MKKAEILENIFNTLMEKGTVSEKGDVLGEDPIEDKVYTKRIKVDTYLSDMRIMYVSVTSDEKDFSDVSVTDMRVNIKNVYEKWLNLFAHQTGEEILTKVYETVCV